MALWDEASRLVTVGLFYFGGGIGLKSTGVVRKVDELGRVVIPMELRRTMGITRRTPLEIFTEGDTIILRKYAPGCVFCGEMEAHEYRGQLVCTACAKGLAS